MRLPKFDIRFLYVMFTYSMLYRFKCGITNDVSRRRQEIETSLSRAMNRQVKVRVAICIPSLFTEQQEAKIHRWLHGLRDRGQKVHSGYSEWFWYLNPLGAVSLFFLLRHYGANVTPCHIALFAIAPLFPLDAVLLVFAVFLAELITVLAVVLIAAYIFMYLTGISI